MQLAMNALQVIAERLQMPDPSVSYLHHASGRTKGLFSKAHALESSSSIYLAQCYARCCAESTEPAKVCVCVYVCGCTYMYVHVCLLK